MTTLGRILLAGSLLLAMPTMGQNCSVDKQGTLLNADGTEAVYFGFNYCMPFAHGYRMHSRLGIDHKQAIDTDVLHMSRMGATAYRIHVWDVEISDQHGNLLCNEHLDLLDYTIAQFAARGIKTTITAIAFWGNGWPEPDDKLLPGFSNQVWKCYSTTDPATIHAQEVYLKALMNHTNKYTGYQYKTDPNIVAIELNNEPDHAEPVTDQFVTKYINRLAAAVRNTGCRKPIFYNVAQNDNRMQAVLKANINGFTCQWYPTGLVGSHARTENFTQAVSEYNLPSVIEQYGKGKARMIYEFDAADMSASYVYPIMARAFRKSGFQWATQFAYDPLAIAANNTDYQTHYLNLIYTPEKAVSYRIAAYEFLNSSRFGYGNSAVSTSYADNISVLNADTIFCYSNSTNTAPISAGNLRHIMGCHSSSVVAYDGTGAYLLDQIAEGIWRLELYPDVMPACDAYARNNSLLRDVTKVQENVRTMSVNLPDLGTGFSYKAIAHANAIGTANGNAFSVTPGVYILQRNNIATTVLPKRIGNIDINEYAVCNTNVDKTIINHTPAAEVDNSKPLHIEALIASPYKITDVTLYGQMKYGKAFEVKLTHSKGFTFAADIEPDKLSAGIAQYSICVVTTNDTVTFPSQCHLLPSSWDYYATQQYQTIVREANEPVNIFSATRNVDAAEVVWRSGINHTYKADAIDMSVENTDEYSKAATGGLLIDLTSTIANRQLAAGKAYRINIVANAVSQATELQLILIDNNGDQFATDVTVANGTNTIMLSSFAPAEKLPVRDGYPLFAYKTTHTDNSKTIINTQLTSLRIVLKSGSLEINSICMY